MALDSVEVAYRIFTRKDALKFASAHMTVFPDGSKEALHGHNYRTELQVDLVRIDLENMLPFSLFKERLKEICNQLDEKVLLATKNPHFQLAPLSEKSLRFTLCGRDYLLPREEVELLELDNITTETLAYYVGKSLIERLPEEIFSTIVSALTVKVEEMTGQGSSATFRFPDKRKP